MKKSILCILILFLSFKVSASNITFLEDSVDEYKIFSNELEIYEDVYNNTTFDEILSNPDKYNFRKYDVIECYSKNPSHTYWLRFKVQDNSGHNNKWIVEILDSRFDEVIFYTVDVSDAAKYKANITGIIHPFEKRQYKHKNFVFDFPVLADQKPHYHYIKITPGVVGSFILKIRQNKIFSSYAFNEYAMLGMYYGILLIMAFYNLFIYFSIRERVYLYYFLYVIIWAFNSGLDDSLGYQYVWTDYPSVSKVGGYLSKVFLLAFYILYSQRFLNIKNNFSDEHKSFYKTALFFLACSVVMVYLNLTIIYNLVFTIIFAYISYNSYIVYKKGYRPARFFLLGNGIIVAGSIVYLLKNSGIFEAYSNEHPGLHIFMVYIKNVIMVIDIVILSIALSDRMKFLKQSAEAAQLEAYNQLNEKKLLSEKVNRELEQKVAERTKEIQEQKLLLEEANHKLKQQAEEINKMNALLDLDNWNLKKNVMQEKEARIVLKDINFEEFKLVYPNEAACYRLIEEIKNEKGFICKKCGKDKYGKGVNTFSRRCVNCRYDESVTAYTVFHGCKFNIQVAMYIVAMINRYGDTIPITNISKEVNLRNATCWKFAQKLLTTRESKEYKQANESEKLKVLILNA